MNVRGVLFILSVVSTMYRIGSKADLLRRQEEVDAGLGLDATFTINKSMLCDSGRNWIKKHLQLSTLLLNGKFIFVLTML